MESLLKHQKVSKYYDHDCRFTLINVNSNEIVFYQLTVSVNKCGGTEVVTL